MRSVVFLAVALAAAPPSRLSDEALGRLLSEVAADVERLPGGEAEALREPAALMRERYGGRETAGAEVVAFLRLAHGASLQSPGLEEKIARLAGAYGVDRSLDPALWRSLRMSDAELAAVLTSLASVAGSFERELEQISKLLDPCTIVGGEREAILETAERLDDDAEALRRAVERDGDTTRELDALMSTASDLEAFLERHSITRVLRETWGPVARDLSQVERAFGYEPSN